MADSGVAMADVMHLLEAESSSGKLVAEDKTFQACVSRKSRKLFGAVFGCVSRVPESVSQSARFSPEIFGDVFGKCNARNSKEFSSP